jgi:hypothetical protein
MTAQNAHTQPQPQPPTDVGDAYDPFQATRPAIVVHDVDTDTFEQAWNDRETRCPQCGKGTPDRRGESPFDHRRWVGFTCEDFVALEQTAG